MAVTSTVGVVGAGNMGSGLAQMFATEGADAILVDLDLAAAERGRESIHETLVEGVERGVFTPARAETILGRVRASDDPGELSGAALVVEAVYEDFDTKRRVFERLDQACGPSVLLATNTSSFRVSDLQQGLAHPDRVVGLHFFYHPAKNRLVEVVGGEDTDPHSVERAWHLMEVFGKTPIASADSAGFLVNRFFVPVLNEAVRLREEGHGTLDQIDRVARERFGTGLGPFALMNVTGLAIVLQAANSLGQALGPLYEPARLLERMVSGSATWEVSGGAPQVDEGLRAIIEARLCGAAWLASGHLVDAGVGRMVDADIGARVGLRWRRGPFELANHLSLRRAIGDIETVARRFELRVPRCFAERLEEDPHHFELPTVRCEVHGGVATITFDRPDQLNALSPRLLLDLEAAWAGIEGDDAVQGVVLHGAGKAFMAGAALEFFAEALATSDLASIRAFCARAAALYARIDESPKRVVAVLDGLSLGGGSELALCADYIVASDRGSLGFPETGLGIYPGLGGTQRTVRRLGRPLARYLIWTGRVVDARNAHGVGLVDAVVGRGRIAGFARELALVEDPRTLLASQPASRSSLAALADRWFGDAEAGGWLDGSLDPGEDEAGQALAQTLRRKSPLALRKAAELIDLAEQGGYVGAGLVAELAGLPEVFGSLDAAEGLRAVLERRRPVFRGS